MCVLLSSLLPASVGAALVSRHSIESAAGSIPPASSSVLGSYALDAHAPAGSNLGSHASSSDVRSRASAPQAARPSVDVLTKLARDNEHMLELLEEQVQKPVVPISFPGLAPFGFCRERYACVC